MAVVTRDAPLEASVRTLVAAAHAARADTRRDGDDERPLGPRAVKTRAKLLAAAYVCFVERGYASTSILLVSERAGVSLGTVYQYFRDKTDIMSTLVADAVIAAGDEMFRPLVLDDPLGIRSVLDGFVRTYADAADFQRVWNEATILEPSLADFRRRIAAVLDGSVETSIRTAQADGLVSTGLDPVLTARSLATMAERTSYLTFVVDERRDRATVDAVVDTLETLWANALGLRPPNP